MSIVGHNPMSSEGAARSAVRGAAEPRSIRNLGVSSQEAVRSYLRRSQRGPAPLAALIGTPRAAPLRDVSDAAFGRADRLEVIQGDDDRVVVPDATQAPYRHICALHIETPGGRWVGTGWFAGPHTVVTAGHCVYLHDEGGWPLSIEVLPALQGGMTPYGTWRANRYRTTRGWHDEKDTNFDYGCIQLDADVPGVGALGFAAFGDDELRSQEANISGYPLDKDQGTRQYFHARKVSTISARKLLYDVDTYGGQSGSPIWFAFGEQRIAVGIHTTGSTAGNSGTRIDPDVFQNIEAWRRESLGGPPGAGAVQGERAS